MTLIIQHMYKAVSLLFLDRACEIYVLLYAISCVADYIGLIKNGIYAFPLGFGAKYDNYEITMWNYSVVYLIIFVFTENRT